MRATPCSDFKASIRRAAIILVVVGAAAAALAGCGPSRAQYAGPNQSRKIEVMSSDGWIYNVVGEITKRFEKASGIKVSFTIYAPNVYYRALQTLLVAGEAPDIFLIQSTRWSLGTELDPQTCCIDLTNEPWTKRLKPEWLPAVSYKGRIYGLIIWDDTLGWVYTFNDKIFKRLGLQLPTAEAPFSWRRF